MWFEVISLMCASSVRQDTYINSVGSIQIICSGDMFSFCFWCVGSHVVMVLTTGLLGRTRSSALVGLVPAAMPGLGAAPAVSQAPAPPAVPARDRSSSSSSCGSCSSDHNDNEDKPAVSVDTPCLKGAQK